jgi:hypothetical protein
MLTSPTTSEPHAVTAARCNIDPQLLDIQAPSLATLTAQNVMDNAPLVSQAHRISDGDASDADIHEINNVSRENYLHQL